MWYVEAMATEATGKPLGRPRDAAVDEAVLRAAIELLVESGLAGTTMGAVAERAGVARATVYLRWPSRDDLIQAALRVAIGGTPFPLSGDLETDIRRGGERARSVFSRREFQAILPEVVRALLSKDGPTNYDALAPNRRLIGEEYRALAAGSGFRTDVDPEIIIDLVVGAHFNHLLATGEGPSAKETRQMLDIIIAGLRRPPGP